MERDDRLLAGLLKTVRLAGYLLLAAALVYCALALRELGIDAMSDGLSAQSWIVTGLGGIAYGAALVLLAVGWGGVAAREQSISLVAALAIYGPAVVAKYVPGSVFQYGSRQVTGMEFGLAQKPMAWASLVEAGLHVPCAMLCGAVLLAGGYPGLATLGIIGLSTGVFASSSIVRATGFQLAFFAIFAGLMAGLAKAALPSADPHFLAAMFMFAWVAGFLVPVAPGGIGVRETALLALAVPAESAAAVAAFALLTRLATSIGDASIGAAGYWLMFSRRWNRQASA